MAALVQDGFGAYVLITNQTVARTTEVQLRRRARAAGFERFEVHGRDQVIRRIRSSPRLRALAPRLYGVGDLSQIFDERRIEQAKALIVSAKSDIDRFVATDAYRASVRALDSVGVVVLLGAPAAGKSTIAKALSIAAIDTFDATPFILESLSQITIHWNPDDPARLFWVDDVFGSTQVDPSAADSFNRLGSQWAFERLSSVAFAPPLGCEPSCAVGTSQLRKYRSFPRGARTTPWQPSPLRFPSPSAAPASGPTRRRPSGSGGRGGAAGWSCARVPRPSGRRMEAKAIRANGLLTNDCCQSTRCYPMRCWASSHSRSP